MSDEKLSEIIEFLDAIKEEVTLPKNVKFKIDLAISSLSEESMEIPVKVNKSLQELGDILEDPNTPSHIRTQMWNVVSILESI